jgi:4-amino-4-deoxy-L-arabinose transferase-like glycosyltransferase
MSPAEDPAISPRTYWIVLAVIILMGALLRFIPSAGFTSRGFDEHIYVYHLSFLETRGLFEYPDHCLDYLVKQAKDTNAIPPPSRVLYLFFAHLWRAVTGAELYPALVKTSALFSTLTLVLTAGFIRRIAGLGLSLAVTALMSVAMNQIHQAQHAMNDGFFTFWCVLALWSLWENLQQPGRRVWMITYAVSLAAMVMVKENSFFVVVAICGLLLLNRWLHFGTAGKPLWLLTFIGPLVGFVILVFLAGGIDVLVAVFRLVVAKSQAVPYMIKHGDGPWYRYFVELMLVSPLVMVLAIGRAFQLRAADKASLYLLLFVGFTMAMMVNIKYGMNLRYATIWDLPLRFLACAGLFQLCARFASHARLLTVVATVVFALLELNQYRVFCMKAPTYALTPAELLQAARVVK